MIVVGSGSCMSYFTVRCDRADVDRKGQNDGRRRAGVSRAVRQGERDDVAARRRAVFCSAANDDDTLFAVDGVGRRVALPAGGSVVSAPSQQRTMFLACALRYRQTAVE